MNKTEVALFVYKSVDKTIDKIIDKSAKEYLKPLKDKPWHDVALKYYKRLTKEVLNVLKKYRDTYSKGLEDKNLFKAKVKKDDDIEDDLDDLEDLLDDEAEEFIDDTTEELLEELKDLFEKLDEELVVNAAKEISSDLGIKFNYNKFDKLTRDYLKSKSIKWSQQVSETTEKTIKEILVKGFKKGLGSHDIAQMIREHTNFSFHRAEDIARTEIIGSCNYADNATWNMDDSIIGKEWSSTGDTRTRGTHRIANGQKVRKDQPFIIGGYKLMHPGDTSLGAAAKEIIKCRCTMFPIFEGESLD